MPQFSHSDFASTLNTTYRVASTEPPVDLKLIEVGPLTDRGAFESYSLIFEASECAPLIQQTYCLQHDRLGKQDIFLVPQATGKNNDVNTHRYQALFSQEKFAG